MIKFKFISTQDPEYGLELALRWEALKKPLGQPPGTEVCPEDKQGIHLVALEKREVIGCILCAKESTSTSKIVQMAMSQQRDHQGFARKLLHQLEQHLYQLGYRELHCVGDDENISFYERLGFHKISSDVPNVPSYLLKKMIHEAL